MKTISTKNMTYPEWVESRRIGLGGSDVAAILGLSKWGTPYSVWQDKMGISKPTEDNEYMYWGRKLEALVAERFQEVTGLKVRRRNCIFIHPEYPWMIANIDRELVGENTGLEIKTASAWLAHEWEGDSLPDKYYCQVQHYMAVLGWKSCWIAALVGGNKFIHKEVERDQPFIDMLIERERAFWHDYVEAQEAPELSTYDAPEDVFPRATLDLAEATPEAERLAEMLYTAEATAAAAKAEVLELQNRIKQLIGEHEGIQGIATWKNSRGSVSWKAVAQELGASEEIVEKHRGEGQRRFSLNPYKRTREDVA